MSICARRVTLNVSSLRYSRPYRPFCLNRGAPGVTPLIGTRPRCTHSQAPSITSMFPSHVPPARASSVLVLGAGNFGSCLADHLGESGHAVRLWSRKAAFVAHFNATQRNPDYLKDHHFSQNITAVGPDLPDAQMLQESDVLLFAIPTQAVRCARDLACDRMLELVC